MVDELISLVVNSDVTTSSTPVQPERNNAVVLKDYIEKAIKKMQVGACLGYVIVDTSSILFGFANRKSVFEAVGRGTGREVPRFERYNK